MFKNELIEGSKLVDIVKLEVFSKNRYPYKRNLIYWFYFEKPNNS